MLVLQTCRNAISADATRNQKTEEDLRIVIVVNLINQVSDGGT